MHQIAFLLLFLCAHMAWTKDSTDCDGRPCKFGKCVGKKCECDSGFTRRRPWRLLFKQENSGTEYLEDFSCKLIMDTHVPGACSKNATCAFGASCKNDMCTCDEPGWSVGRKGTMYQNMCTAGTMKDCKVTTTATSSSKCIPPIFVACENATNSHSCNCEMPDGQSKPESSYHEESQCRLKVNLHKYDGEVSNKTVRLFWKLPGDKPCAEELLPEYTCGCKEGTESCDYIVGAKCSGPPEPDCYVPPGIFCNTTIRKCDCDGSQSNIYSPPTIVGESGQCRGIRGARCSQTKDCVKGSNCTYGKCSSCPGTQTLEWSSGQCVVGVMEPCDNDNVECPEGTWCEDRDKKQGNLCYCSAAPRPWTVEYDPVLNVCVSTLGGECSDSRNCKNGSDTVCEYNRHHGIHICVCDKKMGMEETRDSVLFSDNMCLIMENHPCKPGGIRCMSYPYTRYPECLKSEDGQFRCIVKEDPEKTTKFRKNAQENIIGSNPMIGFGLTVIFYAIL